MYKCDKCGEIFSEPVYSRELIDGTFYETYWASPCCDDAYVEVTECECCHVNYTEHDYCDECMRDLELLLLEVENSLGTDYRTLIDMISLMEGWR